MFNTDTRKCPRCGSMNIVVKDSRENGEGRIIRRRACLECNSRYVTVEITLDEYDTCKDALCRINEIQQIFMDDRK